MNQIAPYLSYAMLALFAVTCVLVVVGISVKVAKSTLKLIVLFGLTFAVILGAASGTLYIWHWYYR